ncbi:MAG TPA: aromatic hydrocarbon degradation protein [Desulfobulbaceae bacterium]|nr:aromatic hydrocarbon degradation protein [Desulfobulbaceae bacterium]
MKKKSIVAVVAALAVSGTAYGSGYRIPEQSVDSVAKAGANVAYTTGADASYYNPANMSWLEDRGYLEGNLEWIHLKSITYNDNRTSQFNGESEKEDFVLPTFFAVSPDYHNFRVGLSLTYPGGLSKQWPQPYPRTFAEEFTLKVYEFGASAAYKINDMFSFGAGVRTIYADATVRSAGMVAPGVTASRYMDGDTWEWGYNLALSARPTSAMNLSATYRSKVDLDLEGDARLATSAGPGMYNGVGAVSVPLPAVLSLAGSYTFFDQLTVELEYERTYWSDYEKLDFVYPAPLVNPVLNMAFDQPKSKSWDDSDTYRIGLTYDTKKSFILMAGFAYDKTPIPDSTLGFDLPDSDAYLYSFGVRYEATDQLDLGFGYLYDDKDDRSAVNGITHGEYSGSGAHVVTFGVSYKL